MLGSPKHINSLPPPINISHQSGIFVTIEKPTLLLPGVQFTLRITLGVIHPMGFEKFITTCVYHCCIA